ncbi:hypothetical protein CHLNCDRAFT_56306 [Chlorella variabilis]|uniref:Protein phosphatase 1 regulatory subunit 7 n=1 Tax=Chlorella variabilis TaxID=554065 RepID=E1ZNM9_CHLVA|nr:hypothetical protein CHLNCDRAFT_56306 [Chlorella variabilis]EFN52712.1 hypothetical protein CHLNCDRAFT_56306 [Chlorella variabilis]|eukprot:XP_005844814.1 hypothetical protein CHLNCDRAFT_56306 [Chlorella variabilis]
MSGGEDAGAELDLTNAHLPSLDEVDLPSGLTSLDLTANRLRSMEPNLLALTGLRRLCLRQNLVSQVAEVEALASAPVLEALDLRDNQLKALPSLAAFTSLRYLEVSYNEVRSLAPLSSLGSTQLTELFVACNKIAAIESLERLALLHTLELGGNRIRSLEGLSQLGLLQELWLGRNRIAELGDCLSSLHNLRRLSLQSNRLTSMAGLQHCTALEELYLSHNGIEQLEGLDRLVNLKILDVANNRIQRIGNLGVLQLTDLWANDNQIGSLDEVEAALKSQRGSMSCVYLRGNPCAAGTDYKLRMKFTLPRLEQLDDSPVA